MPDANVASESIAKILGSSNEQAKLRLLKGIVICKGDDGFNVSLGNSQNGKCSLTESADLSLGTEAEFIVVAVQPNGVKTLSRRLYLVLAQLEESAVQSKSTSRKSLRRAIGEPDWIAYLILEFWLGFQRIFPLGV